MSENNSMDSLLDATLDDLADMPEFAIFPAGVHRCTISFEQKEVNKHPAIEAKFKLLETVELADPSETAQAAGTESSVLYLMDNEFGQGGFKAIAKPIGASLGVTSLRDVIEKAAGTEVVIVTKVRPNKDKTANYMAVVSLEVV